MKKISFIFVCVLLSVFCLSSVSYSESDSSLLSEYSNELYKNHRKTVFDNHSDFVYIMNSKVDMALNLIDERL